MNRAKKSLVLLLALCMVFAIVMAGCTEAPPAQPADQVDKPADPADPAKPAEPAADTDGEMHELYTLLPQTSLTGVFSPDLPDRANIDKAWPKTPKDPNKIVIGWTEITLGNPWFVEMARAAEETAAKYGFQLDMLVADGSVERQSEHIDTFITRGVDIIVVDPCDVLGPVNDIKRAVEAGIPVVGMGTVMDESAPILTTVILNPFEVGYSAGQYVSTYFEPDQNVNLAIVLGVMGNSTSESRICGGISGMIAERQRQNGTFVSKEDAILAGYKLFDQVKRTGRGEDSVNKFTVLAYGDGQWTEEGGLAVTEDILTAVGDQLDLIIACNDFEALGALKAVQARGLQDSIKIAAFADGAKTGLDAVIAGDLICSGTFGGPGFGAHTIEFIKAIFIDGKDPSNLPMGTFGPVSVINRENMDQFYDDDPSNLFYKIPDFEFPKSIPEIKASFGN